MPEFDRDILNNARMATFDRAPSTHVAKAWVLELLEATLTFEKRFDCKKRSRSATAIASLKNAVGAFAIDLIRHNANL